MKIENLLLTAVLLAIPFSISAKQSIVWDFTGGKTPPGKWEVRGLEQAVPETGGLAIQTAKDGYMTANTDFGQDIGAVTITLVSTKSMESVLLWKEITSSHSGYRQLPFYIEGSEEEQIISIDLSNAWKWNPRTQEFGIALPSGAEILIKEIRFDGWNVFEKAGNAAKSFWKFDRFTPQSINFLWGPWINFNPVARGDMYMMDPPLGIPGMWIIYASLALLGFALSALTLAGKIGRAKATTIFAGVFAALWLVLDARMGLEILSYAKTDLNEFVFAEEGSRNLRIFRSFPETAQDALPLLSNNSPYFFIGPEGKSLYFSAMRYLSYPAYPVSSGPGFESAKTGLVFANAETGIDENGNLVKSGKIIKADPCEIMKKYRDDSFLVQCSK